MVDINGPDQRRAFAAFAAAVHSLSEFERVCLTARARGMRLRQIGELVRLDFRLVAEVIAYAVETLQRRSGQL